MTLFSFQSQRPAPLPWRITLPSGFTRTDPSTFTEEELQAAGFTGPYTEPPYDPATQQLSWDGTGYVVEPFPPAPPVPDWITFKAVALSSSSLNGVMASAYQSCPVAAGALAPALLRAEQGEIADFEAAWSAICAAVTVPQGLASGFQDTAASCHLPEEFIAALSPGRVRARNADGTFRADDPATPEDEAWEP